MIESLVQPVLRREEGQRSELLRRLHSIHQSDHIREETRSYLQQRESNFRIFRTNEKLVSVEMSFWSTNQPTNQPTSMSFALSMTSPSFSSSETLRPQF
jgi:hypothetical protein